MVLSIFLTACRDFIVIDPPNDRINTVAVFADDATATSAVLGIYTKLNSTATPFSNGGTTIYCGMYADELTYTIATDQNGTQFLENNLTPTNNLVYNAFWRNAYEIIYHSNRCIEGLEQSTSLTPELKNQLLGECYFIRAFCYWYLVNNFGDVPLTTLTTYEDNATLSRSEVAEVMAQINNDLLTARDLLLPEYPTAGKFRVNYHVATALLARYYLYNKEWQLAQQTASEVINSPLYTFETELLNVFPTSSTEAIWQLPIDESIFNTIEGNRFIPTPVGIPRYPVTDELLEAFSSADLRKISWLTSKTVADVTYTYPHKYKVRSNAVKTESLIIFRITEMYMIRAEAIAMQDNMDLNDALLDLNRVRNRANLTSLNSTDRSFVVEAIVGERRLEFFAENGHRFYDLKRLNRLDEALAHKPGWNTEDRLFPIPLNEILANPFLTQNEDYD